MPSSRHVRNTRSAISPRFATKSFMPVRERARPRRGRARLPQQPGRVVWRCADRTPDAGLPKASGPDGSPRSRLLAGVEQVVRVERALDRRVQLERARAELPLEPVAFDEADPVLA